MWFKKLVKKVWIYLRPFFDIRFLISYFIPFMFTNGWAWIGAAILPIIGANWFTIAATTWLGILWMPWTPEKIITIPIAIWIHTKLFKKNNEHLDRMYEEAKKDWNNIKNKFRRTKQ